MIYEKIDLYEHFRLPRAGREGGTLTVYCRETYGDLAPKRRPAILVIPGGGYQMVSAREGEPVAMRFLQDGFCAAVLEYSVQTAYPVPLIEGAMAMAYLRERAESYGIVPEKVGVIGFSAGGHLAGMLSTLYAEEPVRAALGDRPVRPDFAVLCYGVLSTKPEIFHGGTAQVISGGDAVLSAALSLEDRVTKDCPPVFLLHTFEDGVVPVENSLQFAAACRKAGVPFELHVFEKGWHGVSIVSPETESDEERLKQIVHLAPWPSLVLGWLATRGFAVQL